MRINAITVQNFLGLPNFRHTLAHPFLFVAGGNGRGKTSLQDAIRFGLLGELARGVHLVKDRHKLITDGAAAGFVALTVDGYEQRRNIASGKTDGDAIDVSAGWVDLCLDAHRFAGLDEATRRRALFDLSKVPVDRKVVAQELLDAGIAESFVDEVFPLLREGFPTAADYAKRKATEARGAWKAVTGEAYGSVKGETWAPAQTEGDAPDPAELEDVRTRIATGEAKVAALREAKGRADAALPAERIAELQAQVARIPELVVAVDRADAAETEARDAHAQARQRANDLARAGETPHALTCPHCAGLVSIAPGGGLVAGDAPPVAPKASETKAAGLALERASNALTAARAATAKAMAAHAEAMGAEKVLANLPSLQDGDRDAAGLLPEAIAHLEVHRRTLRTLEQAERTAAANAGLAIAAKAEHDRAKAYTALEEKLSPNGIPAVLLARALQPINDTLVALANSAGFRHPQIETDLRITYGGRDYLLCSESERWRADAVFAAMVAYRGGARLLLLDRFDVLEPEDRGQVIEWLVALTTEAYIDTVIVAGTLKSAPDLSDLPADVVWLGNNAEKEVA